ncbi:hypothetical protein XELAEV_18003758mg [Xenopus laevis]|nr:hypothetical protein XELAEV_18003758mg [Xenopus laevis]
MIRLKSLYKQQINWAIFKYMETYPESPPATSTVEIYTVPHIVFNPSLKMQKSGLQTAWGPMERQECRVHFVA